jgi:transcriptional regulator with PAS, ATPase and Fis domain
VLNYLKRTFSSLYDLRLFSEEKAFLRDLEAMQRPSLVLLAWDGIAQSMPLFTRVRNTRAEVPVLIVATTAEMGDYEVFARLGASGVVLKPFVDDSLEVAIAKHLLVHKEEAGEPKEIRLEGGHSFVRSSKRMREVEAQAMLVARSDIPVLILGESGTGKEIVAMFTHQMSRRSGKMFLKVNCAAMPADLLESELFGYEQGAFTGATKSKPGKFEICDGGTIFLDEIGEMPAALQAKLLHVLQDGTFSRLGGRGPTRTDVRVIAATNVNMKEAMAKKTFREDLYYRLNGLSLVLPPLRDRLDEIPAMASYFMRKGAKKYELQPLPISPALLDALSKYHWPGNLREMENVINRYLILQDEKAVITELEQARSAPAAADKVQDHVEAGGLKKLVRGLKGEAESSVIAGVLEETGWNRKAAANDLQISYKALLYKIKQYDLAPRSA